MQDTRYIHQNAGHTAQNDDCDMCNVAATLNVCQVPNPILETT